MLEGITAWMAVNSEGIYCHAPVEDLRRRPLDQGEDRDRKLQRGQAEGL